MYQFKILIITFVLIFFSSISSYSLQCSEFFKGGLKLHLQTSEADSQLSREQQVELAILFFETGNAAYRNKVIESYYPLVHKLVVRSTHHSPELREDIFQQVILRLIKAFDSYAKKVVEVNKRGEAAKFGTYLKDTIPAIVAIELMTEKYALKIPRGDLYASLLEYYNKGFTIDQVLDIYKRKSEELGRNFGLSRKSVEAAYKYFGSRETSVDQEIISRDESGKTNMLEAGDFAADVQKNGSNIPRPENYTMMVSSDRAIRNVLEEFIESYESLSRFNNEESKARRMGIVRRVVFEFLYVNDATGSKESTIAEIASDYNVHPNYINVLKKDVIERLNKPFWRSQLLPLLTSSRRQ